MATNVFIGKKPISTSNSGCSSCTGNGLTPEQEVKVNSLKINGNGDKALFDDGTYKDIPTQEELDEVKQSFDDAIVDVTDLTTKVNEITTDMTDLENKVTNIEQTTTDVTELTTKVGTIESNISDLTTKVTDLEQNSTDIANLDTKVTELDNKMTDVEADIADLNSKIANTDVTELSNKVTTLEGKVTTLETNVGDLVTGLTETDGKVTTLEGSVSTIETSVSEQGTKITTIEGNVTTLETNLTDLNTELTDLDNKVGELETDLTDHIDNTDVHVSEEEKNLLTTLKTNKGTYSSEEALKTANPTATTGDYAICYNGKNYTLWSYTTEWVDTSTIDTIESVNGLTGKVVLDATNINYTTDVTLQEEIDKKLENNNFIQGENITIVTDVNGDLKIDCDINFEEVTEDDILALF